MNIKKIEDTQIWTDFLVELDRNTFLHSLGWVDFNQKYGYKTWLLGLYEEEVLVSVAFLFKLEAKRGHFLFCPHGPQAKNMKVEYLQAWTSYFKKLAIMEGCAFVRISPIEDDTKMNRELFKVCGYINSPMHMHAELTSVLDITGTLEEVRMRIKKNARYDLRKAEDLFQKKELAWEFSKYITQEMYDVYRDTFERGHFVPFSQEYLQAELTSFLDTGKCSLIALRHNEKLISWGLIIFFGKRAFYHQGANILIKGVPAPSLLQWQAIQIARQNGCVSYDFWGVAPDTNPKHPWQGISKFKRSFGGVDVAHMPAQDLIVNYLKYFPTWVVETIRRKKRGF